LPGKEFSARQAAVIRAARTSSASTIGCIAVIGTGLIGTGWVARYLQSGFRVLAWDPAPGFDGLLRERLHGIFARMRIEPERQACFLDALQIADTAADAAAAADFVQENGPEVLAAKREILHELAAAAPPETVIASSSSGLRMSDLQRGCATAQRLVIGHPFNPVYLLPLVEVVAGEETGDEAVAVAADLYRSTGQSPVICTRDNTGFIGNRLQEAMFREALHMVDAGEATPEQIDAVVTQGPGLRWAFMGPFLAYHLTGGQDGIRGFFERFGDSLLEPYSRLQAPALTDQLVARVSHAVEEAYGGRSPAQLECWRDERLRRILSALNAAESETDETGNSAPHQAQSGGH
jgi:carnitine 3-dehydrogenase